MNAAAISAGSDATSAETFVGSVTASARAPLMFSANGVRPAQNNYMLDGIDNNTSNVDFLSGVAYIVKPPVDAVDEIKILTSSFSAEYGRAGGAVLNTTLKSGTNQFRGSLWEFVRDDALNATDFFANRAGLKKGKYVSNQFGFTAGGPVVKGKTFFFVDYEGSISKQDQIWQVTVPTARVGKTSAGRMTLPHAPWQNITQVMQMMASDVPVKPNPET